MKIFISHSSKDKNIIGPLVIALERLNCEVFYSSKAYTNKIDFGEVFYEKIREEIESSDYILAMLSGNFYSSVPSQIEMGIAYAFNKNIKPIAIEKRTYSELLKGIFTSNHRLASIYNKEDMILILGLFSREISKILSCASDVIDKSHNSEDVDSIVKNQITTTISPQNYIEKLILSGQFNINECIFLRYMEYKRRFRFEWAWQTNEGAKRFDSWLESSFYYVEGEVEEVYKDIINHFNDLSLLEEDEFTSERNVRLYKLKPIYSEQLLELCKENSEIIDSECKKQYGLPF